MGEEEEGEDEEQGEYDVMSMDDFLMENNIRMDSSPEVLLLSHFFAALGIRMIM